MADETSAIAAGVAFSFDLGSGKSLNLQTHIFRDETPDEWNVLLDKLREAGERQRLFSMLENAELNIRVNKREMRKFEEQEAAAEEAFIAETDARRKAISTIEASMEQIVFQGATVHAARGGRSEYEPDHHDKALITAKTRDRDKLVQAQADAERERDNARKSLAQARRSTTQAIDGLHVEIRDLKAKIGLPHWEG